MKITKSLPLLLAGLVSSVLLAACDVAFDGPKYHFKVVNRTRATIKDVTINAGGIEWPCGVMPPNRSCTAPYLIVPASVTVNYTSNSDWGYQGVLSQVFATDSTKAFDEKNLYLDTEYFTLEMENRTTDLPLEVPPEDYLITGFKTIDQDTSVVQYDFTESINNDGKTYCLGFFDRYDADPDLDPLDTTGTLKVTALVENDGVAENEADWTTVDLQPDDHLFLLPNSDGDGYYVKLVFLDANNIFYDTYREDDEEE